MLGEIVRARSFAIFFRRCHNEIVVPACATFVNSSKIMSKLLAQLVTRWATACSDGFTENAGPENGGPKKIKERKMQNQMPGVENAGPENAGPENHGRKIKDQRPEADF